MDESGIDTNSPTVLASPTSEVPESEPARPPRGFAAIHRDIWRLVGHSPLAFVLLPAALWLPADFILELATSASGGDGWSQFRLYLRLAQVAEMIVGTLVSAVVLAAVVEVGEGRSATIGAALRKGLALWWGIIFITLQLLWRVGLGLLLFILPGIYLMLRYGLSAPVLAFEDKIGRSALDRSAVLMAGSYWRVLRGVSGAALIYIPLASLPFFLTPDDAGPWALARAAMPANVLASFVTIALALIYADLRKGESLASPVGRVDRQEVVASGRWGVSLVALAAVALVAVCVGAFFYQLQLISMADEAWEREAYEESLELYRDAQRWGPEDPYLEYSIGWALYKLDQTESAEQHFARAVKLEPETSVYRVDHARTLIDLNRFSEAREELSNAREQGFDEPELLAELETLAEPADPSPRDPPAP